MSTLLIYGATGYTDRMAAERGESDEPFIMILKDIPSFGAAG